MTREGYGDCFVFFGPHPRRGVGRAPPNGARPKPLSVLRGGGRVQEKTMFDLKEKKKKHGAPILWGRGGEGDSSERAVVAGRPGRIGPATHTGA